MASDTHEDGKKTNKKGYQLYTTSFEPRKSREHNFASGLTITTDLDNVTE